jgi:RecA-family ATPase
VDAVIVTTEDDWEATVKPRLAAAGADLNKVYRVEAVQADGLEDILSLPNDLAELERIVKENDVALIVLDPLLTFVNKKLDTHKDAEVRQALEPVGRLAHNTRSSLIGLIHVNKTSEGDLMNRLMASRAIGAVVRGVLFCASYKPIEQNSGEDPPFEVIGPKRSRFVFGQIKNNLAAKIMRSVEYHVESLIVGHDKEAQRDIEGSLIVIDRMIEENVEDIVLEQEKRRKRTKLKAAKRQRGLLAICQGKVKSLRLRSSRTERRPAIPEAPSTGHGENSETNASPSSTSEQCPKPPLGGS